MQSQTKSEKLPIASSSHARTAAWLSAAVMGLGQFYNRQYAKGVIFLIIYAVGITSLITALGNHLHGLITLGENTGRFEKVGKLTEYVAGDHSIFFMIYGLLSVCAIVLLLLAYGLNIRDAYASGKLRDQGQVAPGFRQSVRNVADHGFPWLLLTLPGIGILFFTIMPILFMILLAFTNYSAPDHIPPKNLVEWVGFQTFVNLLSLKAWAHTFWGVLTWTIIWAVLSTATTYFGGILVAVLIQQKGIRFKTFWRTIFIIPYAIPQFISLLIFRNLLNYQFGPINQYFRMFGLGGLPWLNDPFWAKVSVILVNMWIGIPVSMVLVLGILTAIPNDLYEAADIDGASSFQKFRNITLPYVWFSTAPILIMHFAGNINNFNVIFLLTNGDPKNGDYAYAGHTDLLVTWLYKLTLDNQRYNMASAVGIIIFVIIASISIYNYRKTRSFKEEDSLQ